MERNLTTGSVFRSRALDCLFMGILDLGPSGDALGTTLSRALSMVLSLVLICRRRAHCGSLHRKDRGRRQRCDP